MKDIMDSVRSLIESRKVEFLVLVGGFGESPYLRQQLKMVFGKGDRSIVVAEEPSRKAAAEGASIWHLTRDVKSRAVRYTYGCNLEVEYNDNYRERMFNCYTDASGVVRVPGAFSPWVIKETVLEDNFYHELTYHYVWEPTSRTIWSELSNRVINIYICDALVAPLWILDTQGYPMPGARHLCAVTADLSGLYSELTLQYGFNGRQYYGVQYSVLIALGGTQLSARIRWYQAGVLCEGPATIIPDVFTQ
ncbi:hypothetical protein FRC19_007060 [Serendipita sp. 401]|nr:hypothetical protein FRC19_007060 [Serendipita sp. 401]